MTIKVSQNFPIQQITKNNTFTHRTQPMECDTFNVSFKAQKKKLSFFQKLFGSSYDIASQTTSQRIEDRPTTAFEQALSKGIERHLERSVPAQNLGSIMSPTEFKNFITSPVVKEANFKSTPSNISQGVYLADLDYATNYSNGKENIIDILDKVAKFANKYYAEKQTPFIFAIADRDSIEGVQHAVRIIGENPEKFKNVKFVPAIKLSFAHTAPKSQIGFENSEMLVYGINPFDDKLVAFVKELTSKRKGMVLNFIREVNTMYPEFSYNILEFAEQNRLKFDSDYTVSNLYWRAREYAETKGDTAMRGKKLVPERILQDAAKTLDSLEVIHRASDQKGNPRYATSIDNDSPLNKNIKEVFDRYSTHEQQTQGSLVSTAENIYEDMINVLSEGKGENKPVMAIASPLYLSHYFEDENAKEFPNVVNFLEKLRRESKGMLVAYESLAPNYQIDGNISQEEIDTFNAYMREHTKFHEVGGSFADMKLPTSDEPSYM